MNILKTRENLLSHKGNWITIFFEPLSTEFDKYGMSAIITEINDDDAQTITNNIKNKIYSNGLVQCKVMDKKDDKISNDDMINSNSIYKIYYLHPPALLNY